jgi:hypothetical protein
VIKDIDRIIVRKNACASLESVDICDNSWANVDDGLLVDRVVIINVIVCVGQALTNSVTNPLAKDRDLYTYIRSIYLAKSELKLKNK